MAARPRLLTVLLVVLAFEVGIVLGFYGFQGAVVGFAALSLGAVQLADQRQRQVNGAFRDALRITDIGLCDAAKWMGMDPADLTRALAADRKLDLWRIEMLPSETLSLFYALRAQALGLPSFIRRALDMAPVFGVERRAAR